ncbi:MAG: hypothetical protein RLZZ546_56 [Bacteroidota bacterium]|jgi:predicted CoA-binding protein
MKKTLIVGASNNPDRYSYKAALALQKNGHPIALFGIKKGQVGDYFIKNSFPSKEEDIDTVTLYLGADLQIQYYQMIIDLSPRRVIFNPGTENVEFYKLLSEHNIKYEEACTLVLLATQSY